jgi:hypothetical protein
MIGDLAMNKLVYVGIAILGASLSNLALATGSGAGITLSPHDFTDDVVAGVATPGSEIGGGWNTAEEICRVCHAPHDHALASQYYLSGLLWNHEVSAETYTMYDSTWSSFIDGVQSAQPDGSAKLCLSCHDGSIALDTFDKYAGGTSNVSDYGSNFEVPGFVDGANQDLRGTHPISITYDNVADPALKDPATTAMGLSGVIDDVLDFGKVQCSSCHDVHDQESVAGTPLLRVANDSGTGTASGLCLTCHVK